MGEGEDLRREHAERRDDGQQRQERGCRGRGLDARREETRVLPAGEADLDAYSRLRLGVERYRDGVVEDPVEVRQLRIEDHLGDRQDGGALGIGSREPRGSEPVQERQLPVGSRRVVGPTRHGPAVIPS